MGMIDGLVNADSIPVLEAAMQFAARRHSVIQHNIANLTTPGFQTRDVSVEDFHEALGEAVEHRRAASRGEGGTRGGQLEFEGNSEVKMHPDGTMELRPRTPTGNILFHDRNDRDLEKSMQALAENVAAFRVASEFLRGRYEMLNTAIRERP